MPYEPHQQYQGAEYLFKGITESADELSKALAKYEEERKQKQFNQGIFDALKESGSPIPAEALSKWNTWNTDKQGGFLAGHMRGISEKQATQKAADEHMLAQAHAKYFESQAAAKTNPEEMQLTPAETAAAAEAGKVPLRTSKGSFQYADMPEKDQPVTDEQGNTQFTPDGTQYKTKSGWKPVTGPMVQAHIVADANKQLEAAKKSAEAIGKNPPKSEGSIFDPRTWGGTPAAPQSDPATVALAKKALTDPAATAEQKAAAKKILGQ